VENIYGVKSIKELTIRRTFFVLWGI